MLSIVYFLIVISGVVPFFANIVTHTRENAVAKKMVTRLVKRGFTSSSDVIMHGDRHKKAIALTFDADMTYGMQRMLHDGEVNSLYDTQLIQELETSHTKATLFLTGLWIEAYPDVTKELAKNTLFELANHSYSHPTFHGYCYGLPTMGSLSEVDEIEKTQKLLLGVGVDNHYFRFPGGCYGPSDISLLRKLTISAVQWDVVAQDGFNGNEQKIVSNVVDNVHNGSIIVMHMNGFPNEPKTALAVSKIIKILKNRGYIFVTIDELLHS